MLATLTTVGRGFLRGVEHRLGRSILNGLTGLGIVYFLNVMGAWIIPVEGLLPLATMTGMDPVEHEAMLRRLMLGISLEGGGVLASIIAMLSFLIRSTASVVREIRIPHAPNREGMTHG